MSEDYKCIPIHNFVLWPLSCVAFQASLLHFVLEGLLVAWLLWFIFRKSYKTQSIPSLTKEVRTNWFCMECSVLRVLFKVDLYLTFKEEERIISEWNPEPLVSATPQNHPALKPHVVSGKVWNHFVDLVCVKDFFILLHKKAIVFFFFSLFFFFFINILWFSVLICNLIFQAGHYLEVDGITCLNLATHNYLSLVDKPEIEEEAVKSIRKYGVGSCGPRGFYGTVGESLSVRTK